jgi:hypothetical protein
MPILGSFAGISSKAYGLTSNLIGDYFFIAKAEATTGAVASLDFTDIPQQYTHLELTFIGNNTTAAGYIRVRFNGDVGATSYAFRRFDTDGAGQSDNSIVNDNNIEPSFISTTATGVGHFIMQIQNYSNINVYKTATFWGGRHTAGNASQGGGLWKSGSAITSISVLPENNNFSQYSLAILYGIK